MEQERLEGLLQEVRLKRLAADDLYSALHTFGRQHYVEAKQDVETCLTSPEPDIRKIALHVLAKDWRLPEHWETARAFLRDADSECRIEGASALGVLKMNTQDRRTLHLLALVVTNQQEDQIVREAAYAAMRSIHHFDPQEQLHLAARGTATGEMDWDLVQSYLLHEHDVVQLAHPVPENSSTAWPGTPSTPLEAGDVGTIVAIYTNDPIAPAYEVEFVDGTGKTRSLLTLAEDDIEPIIESRYGGP
jgi:Domain of unknown function (DUF4926)